MSNTGIPKSADAGVVFEPGLRRGLAARYEAQRIAFAPVVFQCVRIAWKSGLLARVEAAGDEAGADLDALATDSGFSTYAAGVVLETCLAAGVLRRDEGRFRLTRVGDNVLHDRLTQINIDYNHDVCYRGLFLLEESLRAEQPLGLSTLGDWPTIYQGLSELPEPARTSWFAFDHFYSDSAFAQALPLVFAHRPYRLMDIGANTGKWATHCLRHDPEVQLVLVDLPSQLAMAERNLQVAGLLGRAELHPTDLLDSRQQLPAACDAIWMSQFLTCFSSEAIASIFRRARTALAEGGIVWVLDTFWDRQRHEIARYCLINTSPYFSALASGNSKIYEASTIIALAAAEGLTLAYEHDDLGLSHGLLGFVRA